MTKEELLLGTVVKSTGSWYDILLENGTQVQARILGKFRLEGKKLTNPIGVGDKVVLRLDENGEDFLIEEILSRQNYVVRQSPRKKHDLHLLASNIDQAVLIMTIREPNLKQGFIDRFLLMTEPHNIPAIIVFNKADIYKDKDFVMYAALEEIYTDIGYSVMLTSSVDGLGIDDLIERLAGKTTLIGGQSGVGKTSLLNRMEPTLELKTSELSDFTGKGQHTTTFAEMHLLTNGGRVIDIPGIKTLSFNNLEPMDVAHNFREFFALSPDCKFPDCTHRNEPKCAVKEAIEEGEVSELRYINYITILDEIEQQNYWERHDKM